MHHVYPGNVPDSGELPAALERIPGRLERGRGADWPALAAGADGSLWTAYVEWDGADSDRVAVRRRSPSGGWGPAIEVADGNWDHYLPAIVTLPEGSMVFWSGKGGATSMSSERASMETAR